MSWQDDVKPCACGREGCVVARRENERRCKWNARRYAGYSCCAYAGRMGHSAEDRIKRAQAMQAAAKGAIRDEVEAGALVTNSAWLYTPSGRIKALRAAHGIVVP